MITGITKDEIVEDYASSLGGELIGENTLTIYMPRQPNTAHPSLIHKEFTDEITNILVKVGGGATKYSGTGIWTENETTLREDVEVIFTHFKWENLNKYLTELKSTLLQFGKSTNQDAVGFSINGRFYIIKIGA